MTDTRTLRTKWREAAGNATEDLKQARWSFAWGEKDNAILALAEASDHIKEAIMLLGFASPKEIRDAADWHPVTLYEVPTSNGHSKPKNPRVVLSKPS